MAEATAASAAAQPNGDPQRLQELPVYTRQFLASLEEDDVGFLKFVIQFLRWFRTTGKVAKAIVVFGFGLFGSMVALAQGWDYIVSRFFSKGGPP